MSREEGVERERERDRERERERDGERDGMHKADGGHVQWRVPRRQPHSFCAAVDHRSDHFRHLHHAPARLARQALASTTSDCRDCRKFFSSSSFWR